MKKQTTVEIISGLLIFLFVYTAISKLSNLSLFQSSLHQSPLIGDKAGVLSFTLPITELAISLLLFIPRTRLSGLYASAALMIIFTIYIAYMIVYAPFLPCSCGGVLQQMSWHQHLVFNAGFTLLSLAGCWLGRKKSSKNTTNTRFTVA